MWGKVIDLIVIVVLAVLFFQNNNLSGRLISLETRMASFEGKMDYLQMHSQDLIGLMVNIQPKEAVEEAD